MRLYGFLHLLIIVHVIDHIDPVNLQFTNFEYCSCGLDCTWSFAWKDRRALDALSPFILRHIDAFGTHELALILNAHKRLEYDTGQGDKGSQGSSFSVSHCIKHHLPLEGPINYVVLLFLVWTQLGIQRHSGENRQHSPAGQHHLSAEGGMDGANSCTDLQCGSTFSHLPPALLAASLNVTNASLGWI